MPRPNFPDTEPSISIPQDWPIFYERARWPEAAGLVFMPHAVSQLGDALWSNSDVDLDARRDALEARDPSPENAGMLADLARFFCHLLVKGDLTSYARPVGGEGTSPLGSDVWDRDDAADAIATGRLAIAPPGKAAHDHWIFLDEGEVELLILVHSAAGCSPEDAFGNMYARHLRMVDIVLANMPAIAAASRHKGFAKGGASRSPRRNGRSPTPEELEAMFADAPRVLQPRHQIALEERVRDWLLAGFDRPSEKQVYKAAFRREALREFAPYLTIPLFDAAWRLAVAEVPARSDKGRRPKHDGAVPPAE